VLPKTLIRAIRAWPTTDLAELLGLLHTEIHRRAENERKNAKRRPKHKAEKP
jgi:hypothetical protein